MRNLSAILFDVAALTFLCWPIAMMRKHKQVAVHISECAGCTWDAMLRLAWACVDTAYLIRMKPFITAPVPIAQTMRMLLFGSCLPTSTLA